MTVSSRDQCRRASLPHRPIKVGPIDNLEGGGVYLGGAPP